MSPKRNFPFTYPVSSVSANSKLQIVPFQRCGPSNPIASSVIPPPPNTPPRLMPFERHNGSLKALLGPEAYELQGSPVGYIGMQSPLGRLREN